MAIVRWDPWRELAAMQEEMGRLFERTFGGLKPAKGIRWAPAVDMYDRDDAIVVRAELPGVKAEDVDVSLVENNLRIRGEKRAKEEVKEENLYRMEQFYGSFERVIPLPSEVKAEEVSAAFENGVLEITLPKVKAARPKEIKVQIKGE